MNIAPILRREFEAWLEKKHPWVTILTIVSVAIAIMAIICVLIFLWKGNSIWWKLLITIIIYIFICQVIINSAIKEYFLEFMAEKRKKG